MLTAHHAVAFVVLAVTWGAATLAGALYLRRREPRGLVTHLLALAQTALVAQVGLGLLLLSDHEVLTTFVAAPGPGEVTTLPE